MPAPRGDLDVRESRWQRGHDALTGRVAAPRHDRAVAAPRHDEAVAAGDLDVSEAGAQQGHALSEPRAIDLYAAIADAVHRVPFASRDLDDGKPRSQERPIALSADVQSPGEGLPVAAQRHTVCAPRGDLDVPL